MKLENQKGQTCFVITKRQSRKEHGILRIIDKEEGVLYLKSMNDMFFILIRETSVKSVYINYWN